MRLKEGHIGKIVVLVTEDTVDQEWAIKALKAVNVDRVRWIKLEDLRTNKEQLKF